VNVIMDDYIFVCIFFIFLVLWCCYCGGFYFSFFWLFVWVVFFWKNSGLWKWFFSVMQSGIVSDEVDYHRFKSHGSGRISHLMTILVFWIKLKHSQQ